VIQLAKIITYDLCKQGKDYDSLISAIKKYPLWCKVTESCWVVSSPDTCATIRDNLKSYMDNDDRLFVAALTGETAWSNVQCKDDALKNILK
jgi:hypothetical protein